MNENDTVRDVCAERIESFFVDDDVGGCRIMIPAENVKTRIDRILSAHEREMAAKDAEIARLKECHCEYALPNHGCLAEDKHFHKTIELEHRVSLLERALNPVMEVHLNDGGTTPMSDAICAVAHAQRVMREGV